MKNYCCTKCGSIDIFIDDRGDQKALMCGDCGKWIKWIGKSEIALVERFINDNKKDNTHTIEKADLTRLDNKESTEWTPDVVYKVYCNDDLRTLPLSILKDMKIYIEQIILEKI